MRLAKSNEVFEKPPFWLVFDPENFQNPAAQE
jgi:hypothetical protein